MVQARTGGRRVSLPMVLRYSRITIVGVSRVRYGAFLVDALLDLQRAPAVPLSQRLSDERDFVGVRGVSTGILVGEAQARLKRLSMLLQFLEPFDFPFNRGKKGFF